MANKSEMIHLLMLLFMTRGKSALCGELTVDPPEDLTVSDPGRLGYLDITWSPPSSLTTVTECNLQYQLEYLDSFRNKWAVLRTTGRTYSAQFDLSKDVVVRAYTLLNGRCTNNVMHKSKNYTELIQKPASSGIMGTEAEDFNCVYYNMEWLECNWTRSIQTPPDSQQHLYFWYKRLEEAAKCPEYILSGGLRAGCRFTGTSLPEFSDIIFCVNGSSPEGLLKPTFASLQIQNYIKPTAIDQLNLQTGSDGQLELIWENPVRRLPGHCLEWEVRHSHERSDGKTTLTVIHPEEATLALPPTISEERNCYKIRSKLSKYCVDNSLWSDWSHEICYPAVDDVTVKPESTADLVPVYIYVAAAFIALLVMSMCVWAAIKMKKSEPEKKLASLVTNLLAKTSDFDVSKAFKGQKVCSGSMV